MVFEYPILIAGASVIFLWPSEKKRIFKSTNLARCYVIITELKYFYVICSRVDKNNRNFSGIKKTGINILWRRNYNVWESTWEAEKEVDLFRKEDLASQNLFKACQACTHASVLRDVRATKPAQRRHMPGNIPCERHRLEARLQLFYNTDWMHVTLRIIRCGIWLGCRKWFFKKTHINPSLLRVCCLLSVFLPER